VASGPLSACVCGLNVTAHCHLLEKKNLIAAFQWICELDRQNEIYVSRSSPLLEWQSPSVCRLSAAFHVVDDHYKCRSWVGWLKPSKQPIQLQRAFLIQIKPISCNLTITLQGLLLPLTGLNHGQLAAIVKPSLRRFRRCKCLRVDDVHGRNGRPSFGLLFGQIVRCYGTREYLLWVWKLHKIYII